MAKASNKSNTPDQETDVAPKATVSDDLHRLALSVEGGNTSATVVDELKALAVELKSHKRKDAE